jgi:hypothetical protein
MEDHTAHIETDVSYLWDYRVHIIANQKQKHMTDHLHDIKTMITNLL